MSWKSLLTGVVVGVAASYVVKETLTKEKSLSSTEVLQMVKGAFKERGPINGSWILTEKETLQTASHSYNVYRGGITRMNGSTQEAFEFICDSNTGEILDVYHVS